MVESDGSPDAGHGEEPGLEAAVKGIGQHIAGRVKEMAGELLGDDILEEEGVVQRLDGDLRRAGLEPDRPQHPEPPDGREGESPPEEPLGSGPP